MQFQPYNDTHLVNGGEYFADLEPFALGGHEENVALEEPYACGGVNMSTHDMNLANMHKQRHRSDAQRQRDTKSKQYKALLKYHKELLSRPPVPVRHRKPRGGESEQVPLKGFESLGHSEALHSKYYNLDELPLVQGVPPNIQQPSTHADLERGAMNLGARAGYMAEYSPYMAIPRSYAQPSSDELIADIANEEDETPIQEYADMISEKAGKLRRPRKKRGASLDDEMGQMIMDKVQTYRRGGKGKKQKELLNIVDNLKLDDKKLIKHIKKDNKEFNALARKIKKYYGKGFWDDFVSGFRKGAEIVSKPLQIASMIPGIGPAVFAPIKTVTDFIKP